MTSETALNLTYIDGNLDSVEDDKEGILLYQQLTKFWRMADMYYMYEGSLIPLQSWLKSQWKKGHQK